MTREELRVLIASKDKECALCPTLKCESCYISQLIEICEKLVDEEEANMKCVE